MKSGERVNFGELIAQVRKPLFGRNELTILGGQCAESELLKLIEHWDLAKMPFRIWEYSSEIVLERNTFPKNFALLERGRIFGDGGDLMLRRNGMVFNWRFMGPTGIQSPTDDYGTQSYWDINPGALFHQNEKTGLLWGKWDGEHWIEDRVGAAKLNYPVNNLKKSDRIQLQYIEFTYNGQSKFVWYTGLSRLGVDEDA